MLSGGMVHFPTSGAFIHSGSLVGLVTVVLSGSLPYHGAICMSGSLVRLVTVWVSDSLFISGAFGLRGSPMVW